MLDYNISDVLGWLGSSWLGGVVATLIGGYATYLLGRKSDKEKASLAAHLEQQRTDAAQYDNLTNDWYKFLDILVAYPELGLLAEMHDIEFPIDSPEARRRTAAYDLLLNIFTRAYLIKDALSQPGRLSKIDSWEGWDAWASVYFRKPSMRRHYAIWRGRYFPPGVEDWLDAKVLNAETQEV